MPHPSLPPLSLLPTFEAAGRHTSFKEAARELHLTPSAVSQQIKALEAALGVSLFQRGPRAVSLTADGREYLRDVQVLLDDLGAATRRLRRRATALGALRISTTAFVASEFLIPRLADFRACFPEVELRTESSTHLVDLQHESFDAALRIGQRHMQGTRVLRVGPLTAAAVCAPALAATIACEDDLLRHPLIELRGQEARGWQRYGKRLRAGQVLTLDTYLETVRAAEQGLGIAYAVFPLTTEWVRSGRLVTPLSRRVPLGEGLQWVCRAEDHRPLLDTVGHWLQEAFRQLPPLDPPVS